MMKVKILTLGLIFFFVFFSCDKIKNPYSPETPDSTPVPFYVDFEFEVTTSIALTNGTSFLTEGDYCDFYLYTVGFCMGHLVITHGNPIGSFSSIVKISLISTFQEKIMSIDCELAMTRISMEEWLKSAQFIWTLKLVPITEGFVFSPDEQQMTLTGWAEREVKAIYFTLTKE